METVKNLTRVFLASLPSRHRLSFGVNRNVILKSASNDVRRNKDGLKIKKCCYLTFSKVDPNEGNKVISENEFNYFIADSEEHAKKSLVHQYTQLGEILSAVVPAESKMSAVKAFGKEIAAAVPVLMAVRDEKVTKSMVPKIIAAQDTFIEGFIKAVTPYLDGAGDLIDLLVVKDKSGKYNNLPREDKGFVAKTADNKKITIPSIYVQYFNERNKVKTDDGDNIGDEEIMDENEILAGEDNLLDNI